MSPVAVIGSARLPIAAAAALLLLAGPASAPGARAGTSAGGTLSIEASLDRPEIAPGEAATLTVLIRSSGVNLPDVELPALSGVMVQRAGTAQNFSMSNGRVERSSRSVYRLIGRSEGVVRIPPLRVELGKESAESAPLTLTVTRSAVAPPRAAPQGRPGATPSGVPELFVKTSVDRPRVFWNQQLILRVRLYSRVELVGDVEWKAPSASGFWSEGLGPPRNGTTRLNGVNYSVTEILTALFPTRAGTLTIGPAEIRCRVARVVQPPDPWSALAFPDVVPQDVALRSDPITVTIDPLPPGAPPDFHGAVGSFGLALRVDRREGRVGEPITVHAAIRGEGNVPTIRDPEVRSTAPVRQYVTGSATRIDRDGNRISGERTTDVAFVPDRTGTLTILPLRFSWFDPETGRYRTQTSDTIHVNVLPGNAAEAPGARPEGPGTALAEPRRRSGPMGSLLLDPPAWSTAVAGFSLLVYVSAIAAGALRERRGRDPLHRRRRALEALVTREIPRAEGAAKSGRPEQAAAVAQEALWRGLGLRYDVELAGLPRAEAFQAARSRGANGGEIESLAPLVEALERIAYAPAESRAADATEAIRSVTKRLERYRRDLA
jgi:hypothetical protein